LELLGLHHHDHARCVTVAAEPREVDRAPDGPAAAIDRFDEERLTVAVSPQHLPDRGPEVLDGEADVEVEEVLSDDLVRGQPPELPRSCVPGLDPQLAVDDDDRGLEAREDRLEIEIRRVQVEAALMASFIVSSSSFVAWSSSFVVSSSSFVAWSSSFVVSSSSFVA
jgi:hypothetical protein